MSEKTIDQQFIEYIIKSLVSKPDAVVVDRIIDEKGVLLTLTVDPDDLGRVIGKKGATAQSLRTLLRALGTKQEARFNLKIFDNGVPRPPRNDDNSYEKRQSSEPETKQVDSSNSETESSESSTEDTAVTDDKDVTEKVDFSSKEETKQESEEEKNESSIERTRRELEDLDDLDV